MQIHDLGWFEFSVFDPSVSLDLVVQPTSKKLSFKERKM